MMLKAASSVTPRLNSIAPCSISRNRHAAFKSPRRLQSLIARAAAEDEPSSDSAPPAAVSAPAGRAGGGRNQREQREVTVKLEDVKSGEEFDGVVTSVTPFGAFVHFGAEKEGLVHISQLSNKFITSVEQAVKVKDAVRVRVLSIDAGTGKIALSMKTAAGAEGGNVADVEGMEEESSSNDDGAFSGDPEPEEGHQFVYADAIADFSFPFQMEDEDGDLTVGSLAAFEESDDLDVETVTDLVIPLNELVTGKVTRVEEYGAFVIISYKGKEVKAFLERDEAKIPAASLSPEQLAEYISPDDDEIPAYIAAEFDDLSQYYKEGDSVDAFVLEYNEKGLGLTQYTDAEVEADGLELGDDDDEGEISDDVLSVMGDLTGLDILALMPEDLLLDEFAGGAAAGDVLGDYSDAPDAVLDYKVNGRGGPLTGSLFMQGGDLVAPSIDFPDRPLTKVDSYALNNLKVVDTDFDGDEIYLEDLWQETIHVPKDALKRLGLKITIDDKGESEVIEREGAVVTEDEDWMLSLHGDHNERVAAFVADLLDDEEDEAELPARAMRRPVVLGKAKKSKVQKQ